MNKKIYKFSAEDGLSKKEITTESIMIETLSVDELLGLFRQFIIMIGYDDGIAKRIISLGEDDIEALGIKEELGIYDWDKILR